MSVEGWRSIRDAFPKRNLTFSPEFLRAAHWQEDALNNKDWYMGGDDTNFWAELFIKTLGNINVNIDKPEHLVAAKAMRNSFLALKVSFFNQVYDYCNAHNLDYKAVADAISADDRIGTSHTTITEERGFGGHCFPKDTKATIRSGQAYNTRLTLLEEAIKYNDIIRKN